MMKRYNRDDWRERREFVGVMQTAGLLLALLVLAFLLSGCSALRTPPEQYRSGAMYGDGGATPCMNDCGQPCINEPKQWLKPCGE